jgi:hypothetical protein
MEAALTRRLPRTSRPRDAEFSGFIAEVLDNAGAGEGVVT